MPSTVVATCTYSAISEIPTPSVCGWQQLATELFFIAENVLNCRELSSSCPQNTKQPRYLDSTI